MNPALALLTNRYTSSATTPARATSGNASAKFGKRGGPKLWALADVSFPEEALRLVHAHAEGALHGKAVVLSVEALLVQRVSHLVDGAHDGVHEIFLVVAGGDAHVEGSRAAGEGVHGTIETSFVEIETHLGRHRAAEGLLRVLGEDAVGERGGVLKGRRVEDLLDDGDELLAKLAENLSQARLGHAALELIEEVIVRRHARVRARRGHLLAKLDELGEHRREGVPVVVFPRLDPRGVALGAERRLARLELGGEANRVVVVATSVADDGGAPDATLRGAGGFGGGDGVAVRLGRRLAVLELGECRLLPPARLRGAVGHHHELIPLDGRLDGVQVGELSEAGRQRVVRLGGVAGQGGGGHRTGGGGDPASQKRRAAAGGSEARRGGDDDATEGGRRDGLHLTAVDRARCCARSGEFGGEIDRGRCVGIEAASSPRLRTCLLDRAPRRRPSRPSPRP